MFARMTKNRGGFIFDEKARLRLYYWMNQLVEASLLDEEARGGFIVGRKSSWRLFGVMHALTGLAMIALKLGLLAHAGLSARVRSVTSLVVVGSSDGRRGCKQNFACRLGCAFGFRVRIGRCVSHCVALSSEGGSDSSANSDDE